MNKKCAGCHQFKPLDQFWFSNKAKGYRRSKCVDCLKLDGRIRNKQYYLGNKQEIIRKNSTYSRNNPELKRQISRDHYHRIKLHCFSLFGNICVDCGCSEIDVLQLDHINGGGQLERTKLSNLQILKRAINNPNDYQLLCANCNWRKRNNAEYRSEQITQLRIEAIEKYGGCCGNCEEKDYEVLQFDHIDNDGDNRNSHRNMKARYRKYIREDCRVQLLCCNCHHLKTVKTLRC